MSQTLKLTNFDSSNIVEQTRLTANTPVASNSIAVDNTNDFPANGFILIGGLGGKTSELLQVSTTPSATSIPLTSATTLYHGQYDTVFSLFGDQLRIYRATNVNNAQPSDSSFSLLTTVAIDPNDISTSYTDSGGGGGYWYKYTHYNSVTTSETSLGSSVAVRGTFTVAYCSLDEIRREAGFARSPYVTDDQIDECRQAAQDEINGALDGFYNTPLQPPINSYIKKICIRLSAGYLRKANYSAISDPVVNGQDMIDGAQIEIEKLIMKERVIVDKNGNSLDSPGATGGIDGWPNATTDTTPKADGGAPRVFRMGDIQGQPMTVDSSGNPVGNLYYGRKW